MNAEQLNAIKERAAKATPGPWEVCNGTDVFTSLGAENKDGIKANHNDGWYIAKANEGTTTVGDEEVSPSYSEQNANARFIASCREDVPALVAEVEHLRALLRQRARQLEGERKGSQRVQAENDHLHAELQDIIAVATEEASCLSYESGYEDIVKIANDALK